MPTVTMQVQRTELTGANLGTIFAECVNGAIQGTLRITANKNIVKAVDPGDSITVTFQKG